MSYFPKGVGELRTAVQLLIPTSGKKNGVNYKTYPNQRRHHHDQLEAYGGSERNVNGVYSVVDTATVTTRYRPDIKASCRVLRGDGGAVYEIINEPEDIELRHKYIVFKVERVKGGAYGKKARKNSLTVDFDGFNELIKKLDAIGGDATERAVEQALKESRDLATADLKAAFQKHDTRRKKRRL